jgi:pyruvate, water dikinase
MVHADDACAGVIFTLDPDSGFRDVIVISGSYGLGESVVQGLVTPDEWIVHKPAIGRSAMPIISHRLGTKETLVRLRSDGSQNVVETTDEEQRGRFCLGDAEVVTLADWALKIEEHYSDRLGRSQPMDIEWAKDAASGALLILQARPETVHSRRRTAIATEQYTIDPATARVLVEGNAVGARIAHGVVRIVMTPEQIETVEAGDILVTGMTNPDWEPIMRKVAAIVTDRGGRTAHAAIVSRELGLPCIVGTGDATTTLVNGAIATVSCAEGEIGRVYDGRVPFAIEHVDASQIRPTHTMVMMNVADPEQAFRLAQLPVDGVGLARLEFIINRHVGIHPMAVARFPDLRDAGALDAIRLRVGIEEPVEYFVRRLSEGIARIAAAFYPRPVIVRTSDFKTNEYARLIGGAEFEPLEENPMLGFRGAARYYDARYAEGFALECRAILRARSAMGLSNIVVMIPFCRTVEEARKVIDEMAKHGLVQGTDDLKVYGMCELPSNVVNAEAFLSVFDGYSIGSNDLTQLVLGVDRDAGTMASHFNEMDPSVLAMIDQAIMAAHRLRKPVGICGQAPSDHPEMLRDLIDQHITSISVNPDVAMRTKLAVAELEASQSVVET